MRIANSQLWVHDQDEALEFYTKKLGMEVRSDVTLPELGDFRWLTVGPADQPDFAIVLMAIPGPPLIDAQTNDQIRELMAKGFAGTVFLTTDDCRKSYEELVEARRRVHRAAGGSALRGRRRPARPLRQQPAPHPAPGRLLNPRAFCVTGYVPGDVCGDTKQGFSRT